MRTLQILVKRNTKLFFRDKAMFFTSLITPVILLVLYATFLGNIYRQTFVDALPTGFSLSEKLLGGCVGGQLISSILAVSCVTVSFCSNMLMVQDKANSTATDLHMTPVKPSLFALGYYFSSLISSLIICLTAAGICLIYVGAVGWYMSAVDVCLLLLDVVILVMFGTALSSLINFFLSTQGQISAVGTIVSSGYGFICGAYMPISQFAPGLQKVLAFLPGTYGTSLVRNHAMRGVFAEMERLSLPRELIDGIRDGIDCNLYFLGKSVDVSVMFAVVLSAVAVLMAVYILLNILKTKKLK
ncbi:MAG: ABC transporter permease [Acutalibacteraceae bacterium]